MKYQEIISIMLGLSAGMGLVYFPAFYSNTIGFSNYVLISTSMAIVLFALYEKIFSLHHGSHGKTAALFYFVVFSTALFAAITRNTVVIVISAIVSGLFYSKATFEYDNFFYAKEGVRSTDRRLYLYLAPKMAGSIVALLLGFSARHFVMLSSVMFLMTSAALFVDDTKYVQTVRKRKFALEYDSLVYTASFLSFQFARFATPVLVYNTLGSRAVAFYNFSLTGYLAFVLPRIIPRIYTWRTISTISLLGAVLIFIPSPTIIAVVEMFVTNTVIFSTRHMLLVEKGSTSPLTTEYSARILSNSVLAPAKFFGVVEPTTFAFFSAAFLTLYAFIVNKNK